MSTKVPIEKANPETKSTANTQKGSGKDKGPVFSRTGGGKGSAAAKRKRKNQPELPPCSPMSTMAKEIFKWQEREKGKVRPELNIKMRWGMQEIWVARTVLAIQAMSRLSGVGRMKTLIGNINMIEFASIFSLFKSIFTKCINVGAFWIYDLTFLNKVNPTTYYMTLFQSCFRPDRNVKKFIFSYFCDSIGSLQKSSQAMVSRQEALQGLIDTDESEISINSNCSEKGVGPKVEKWCKRQLQNDPENRCIKMFGAHSCVCVCVCVWKFCNWMG